MKVIEQCFHKVLFVLPYIIIVLFESGNEKTWTIQTKVIKQYPPETTFLMFLAIENVYS